MRKVLYAALIVLVAIIALNSVAAWHCTDTDANQPVSASVAWGDNALLGGTSEGWGESNVAPAGCTGTQGQYVCNDRCDGTTLVEYYCGPWSGDGTIIHMHSYENSTQCNQVPEFGVVAAIVAIVGAIGIIVYRRK
jgi:hypothetical protein